MQALTAELSISKCDPIFLNLFLGQVNAQFNTRSMTSVQKFSSIEKWEEYNEPIPEFSKTSLRANILLEHMSTTKDTSDYLWYTFR